MASWEYNTDMDTSYGASVTRPLRGKHALHSKRGPHCDTVSPSLSLSSLLLSLPPSTYAYAALALVSENRFRTFSWPKCGTRAPSLFCLATERVFYTGRWEKCMRFKCRGLKIYWLQNVLNSMVNGWLALVTITFNAQLLHSLPYLSKGAEAILFAVRKLRATFI